MYFEKQQGQLCAQHALNSLLQGPYFTPIDLGEIASKLDSQESVTCSLLVKENMDDTGYFSVQVISKALEIWSLELIHIDSNLVHGIILKSENAYICNYENHWFTCRKFRDGWYNLDSTLQCPKKLSDTYLELYLLELKNSGYTIFVIRGNLPRELETFEESEKDVDLETAIAQSLGL